jgi:hypothetical protein
MSNTTALIAITVPSSRFVTVLVIPGAVSVLACAHRPWPVVSSWFTKRPVRGTRYGTTKTMFGPGRRSLRACP